MVTRRPTRALSRIPGGGYDGEAQECEPHPHRSRGTKDDTEIRGNLPFSEHRKRNGRLADASGFGPLHAQTRGKIGLKDGNPLPFRNRPGCAEHPAPLNGEK